MVVIVVIQTLNIIDVRDLSTHFCKEIIVFDDNMQSGLKVYRTLTELNKVGINARYIVFSGPKKFLKGLEFLRPKGWENYKQKVTVGTDNERALRALVGLSDLLSNYTNVRLNKNVSILGEKTPTSIDTLEPEHAEMLRRATDLMRKLDTILS